MERYKQKFRLLKNYNKWVQLHLCQSKLVKFNLLPESLTSVCKWNACKEFMWDNAGIVGNGSCKLWTHQRNYTVSNLLYGQLLKYFRPRAKKSMAFRLQTTSCMKISESHYYDLTTGFVCTLEYYILVDKLIHFFIYGRQKFKLSLTFHWKNS